jgi:hypothetical protein
MLAVEPLMNRRRDRDPARVVALTLALLASALILPPRGRTNPIPDPEYALMMSRPGLYLRTQDAEAGRQMVWVLSQYGVGLLLQQADTLALMSRNFDLFAPLAVAAQARPFVPNDQLQAWFRILARPRDRKAMIEALGGWLAAGSDSVAPVLGWRDVPWGPSEARLERMRIQARAAAALADWDARGSLPEMRALQRTMLREAESLGARGYEPLEPLRDALRRLEGGVGSAPIAPDGHGGYRLYRRSGAIAYARTIANDARHRERAVGLDRGELETLWGMIGSAREVVDLPSGRGSIVFQLDGGSAATLQLGSSPGRLVLEYSGRRLGLFDPELFWRVVERIGEPPGEPPIAQPSPARFASERVRLVLDAGRMRVEGVYRFEGGDRAEALPVRFPAAQHPDLAPAEAWVARIASTKRDREAPIVPWISDRPESGLMLSLEAHRPLDVAVGYTQRLLGHHAEYLLTTARGWGAPLDRAVLEVDWPDSLGAPRFSLPFVPSGSAAGRTLYRFEAAPFRPDTDLVVGWGE